jgi:hypothetical protein
MPATTTLRVNGINPGNANQASISFLVSAVVQGAAPTPLAPINLSFPLAEGKEFELGDEYSIDIAPKAEGAH